jgi:hypothetical protein
MRTSEANSISYKSSAAILLFVLVGIPGSRIFG